jgi:HSP20 family protein
MAMCKVSTSTHFVQITQGTGKNGAHWVPNTDVYATEEGLVIKLELAGMRSENLEITVEGNKLRISGQRPDECRTSKCTFWVMEINYGAFENVLELPPGYDLTQARASYLNGFLRIDVPQSAKTQSAKRTKVAIGDK